MSSDSVQGTNVYTSLYTSLYTQAQVPIHSTFDIEMSDEGLEVTGELVTMTAVVVGELPTTQVVGATEVVTEVVTGGDSDVDCDRDGDSGDI